MSQAATEPQNPALEPEISADPVPETAKRVLRGRRLTNHEVEFVVEGDQAVPLAENDDDFVGCSFCPDDFQHGEATIFDEVTGGSCHVRCYNKAYKVEPAGTTDDEPQTESAAYASLIRELREVSADVVIYIKRKSDPVGCKFKNPYVGPAKTIGELAFEDSLDSKSAIELAARSIHGGGYFQFQIFRKGVAQPYVKAWSAVVDDPVETEKPAPPIQTPSVQVAADPLDALVAQAQKLKAIGDAMGWKRGGNGAAENSVPGAPADPMAQLTTSISLIESVVALNEKFRPTPQSTNGDAPERTWVTDLTQLSQAFSLGEMFRALGAPLMMYIGQKAPQWIEKMEREAEAKAAAEAAQQNGASHSAPPARETFQPPAPGLGGSPGASPTANVSRETSPQPSPPQPVVPPGLVQFLSPLVSDMIAHAAAETENDEATGFEPDDERPTSAINRCLMMLQLNPDLRGQLLELAGASGFKLLAWLGTINPAWVSLQDSPDAADYVGWLEDFRAAIKDELAVEARETEGGEVDLSPLADLTAEADEKVVSQPPTPEPVVSN